MKLHIAVDFAETLVKERPMIKWVLFELAYSRKSLCWKIRFMLNSFIRGFLSIVFGNFHATSEWAARTAYLSFKGLSESSIINMVNHKRKKYILNLNPEFMIVLSAIKKKKNIKSIEISIHSQGTCKKAIELFLQRKDVAGELLKEGLNVSFIIANQMETDEDIFTGRLSGKIITKYNKPDGIPAGCIFIGDDHDEKIMSKIKNKRFDFINYKNYL